MVPAKVVLSPRAPMDQVVLLELVVLPESVVLAPPVRAPRSGVVVAPLYINSLLPVAGIGGDIASVRLAHLQGVPGAQAAASAVVDTTVGLATQLVFVMSGVGLLLIHSTERSALLVAWTVLIGTGVFAVAITAFVLFQHRGLFAGFAKLARCLVVEKRLSDLAVSGSAIDDAVVATYRSGPAVSRATAAAWRRATCDWPVGRCSGSRCRRRWSRCWPISSARRRATCSTARRSSSAGPRS